VSPVAVQRTISRNGEGIENDSRCLIISKLILDDPKKPKDGVAKTRHNWDGTWAKKEMNLNFAISCTKEPISITTETWNRDHHCKAHAVRLIHLPKEKLSLRDRGYFGAKAIGIDSSMKRRTTEHQLGELDKRRNLLLFFELRSPVVRPYAVIKTYFGEGKALITVVKWVHFKMMVAAFVFNLCRPFHWKMPKII